MNKKWFSFDVREEVIKDVQNYSISNGIKMPDGIECLSTSALMDVSYLTSFVDEKTATSLRDFIQSRYIYYREKKYGNQAYWMAAQTERQMGYSGRWVDFIEALLDKYTLSGNRVLFVGTANGAEIPPCRKYIFYALEQLVPSANQIKKNGNHVYKIVTGNFEDESLIIDQAHKISCIVALRCLTPNCRIDRFSSFALKNLSTHGTLIISYPVSYIDERGMLVPLPSLNEQLSEFEHKLEEEMILKHGMQMVSCYCSPVEKVYILSCVKGLYEYEKYNSECTCNNEDILNQYAV